MSGRVVRFALALLLGLLTMVYMPAQAWANQAPWVPPSWVAGGAGTEWVSGTATGSGWGLITATEGTAAGASPICWLRAVSYAGSAKPEIRFEVIAGSDCGASSYASSIANVIRQSSQYSCDSGGTWSTYTGNISWDRTSLTATIVQFDSVCAGATKGVWWRQVGATHPDYPTRRMGVWGFELHGGSMVVLQLLCSNGTSTTLVSSSGASVSASCPAGYQVAGGSLQEDGQVVSSVAAPGGVSSAQAAAILAGQGRPVVTQGGYSCDPTMAVGLGDPDWCDRYRSTGTIPDKAVCRFEFSDVTLAVVPLAKADCAAWREVVGGSTPGTDPSGDGGTDLITEWLQRIKTAVDKVKSAVDEAKNGVVKAVSDAADRIIAAIGPGDPGGSGSCPAGGCPSGNPAGPGRGEGPGIGQGDEIGGVQDKFAPLTDWWMEFAHAWEVRPSGDCRGPAMPLPAPMGTIYPLNACEDPMRTIAGLAKLVGTVVLVVGAVLLVVRTQAAAWSFNTDVGKGGES